MVRRLAYLILGGARWVWSKRFTRGVLAALVMLAVAGMLFLYVGYRRDRARLAHEWDRKVTQQPRATPAQIRGRLEALISLAATPEQVPSFLPESMADNVACSAAVCEAVNFIVGGPRLLRNADAWRFFDVNRDVLEETYDRVRQYPDDFVVENGRIVEKYDRRIRLSNLIGSVGTGDALTSSAMFVVGYHFHDTQSDEAILRAGSTWNSHVLLILGRRGGRWYGYHLFHDPRRLEMNPFHVDDLGDELPPQFDLMYVWRIMDGINLTLDQVPQRVVSVTRPYREITRLVGWSNHFTRNASVNSFVDSGIVGWFGDEEQYPQILDGRTSFVGINSPNLQRGWHGQIKGFLNGVPIQRQVGPSRRGEYGREFQCVEFVNRYYSSVLGHRNMTITGNADSYFYDAGSKGLVGFPNGGETPPITNDILVFDSDGPGVHTDPGHVAIVYEVSNTRVCFAQQNTRRSSDCLPVRVQDGRWSVSSLASDRPVVGWSRRREDRNGSSQSPRVAGAPRSLACADRRGRGR